jgi:hypothetical protein
MKTYELRGDCHTEDWRPDWADTSPGCAGLSPPKENEIAIYGRNIFDACRLITRASGRGLALEIETFLGPEMATNEASAIWA